MAKPHAGSARDLVYRAVYSLDADASVAEIVRAVGKKVCRQSIDTALWSGVRDGDIVRSGERGNGGYRYAMAVAHEATGAPIKPALIAASPSPAFSATLGTNCVATAPANRSQGSIQGALRAVLATDASLSLAGVLDALPIGWSRTEALSGLKEGALEGWINYSADGWCLVGEPPGAPAPDPLRIALAPHDARDQLTEINDAVYALLSDAVRERKAPALVRALASAGLEIVTAMSLLEQ